MNVTLDPQVLRTPAPADDVRDVRVAIVGTGFSGLGMAARLREAGIGDFLVFERAGDVGGTWRDNTYPGCACDIPSTLYSFSFATNPNWTKLFPPQPELYAYLRECAERFGVMPHVRFDHEVVGARWIEDRQRWEVETRGGTYTAQVLVGGMGPLADPSVPDIPGLERFEGTTFHSARWRHDHDLRGERVAVIGTGASAIQFIPEIQPLVAHLFVFQRTPAWVIPRPDRPFARPVRWLFRRLPVTQRAVRGGIYAGLETATIGYRDARIMKRAVPLAKAYLRSQIRDPELRAKVTPDYTIGCKRVLLSANYYPTLTQPNVDVITDGIAGIREHSIVTTDGAEHEVDTIIFGTGFHVTDPPAADRVRGRDGVLLRDAWRDGMAAYNGTSIAGFPNLFLIVGPNTGLGNNSMVVMIEAQVGYVVDALRYMDANGVATVEARQDTQDAYNRRIQESLVGTVWTAGGCQSWYLDRGRNTTLWPTFTTLFRQKLRRFNPDAYRLEAA